MPFAPSLLAKVLSVHEMVSPRDLVFERDQSCIFRHDDNWVLERPLKVVLQWRTDGLRSQRIFRLWDYPASCFAPISTIRPYPSSRFPHNSCFQACNGTKSTSKREKGTNTLIEKPGKFRPSLLVAFVQVTIGINYYSTHYGLR